MIRAAGALNAAGLLLALFVAEPAVAAATDDPNPCERAGIEAERSNDVPSGLLLAIGRVESGRWDAGRNRVVPWPWAVGTATAGRFAASKGDAVFATRSALAGGTRNVDVGCFQVSLLHHPDAFSDLEQAFDPTANAMYAARFLASLHQRLGNWNDAVAAYHSADPSRGIPYQHMVQATWAGLPDVGGWASAQPEVRFGIRVWTPSRPGTAPSVVHAGTPADSTLPRIIVPGH